MARGYDLRLTTTMRDDWDVDAESSRSTAWADARAAPDSGQLDGRALELQEIHGPRVLRRHGTGGCARATAAPGSDPVEASTARAAR